VEPHLQGILRLGAPLVVTVDLLRAEAQEVVIGGIKATFSFPTLTPAPDAEPPGFRPLLTSPELVGLRDNIDWHEYFDGYGGWGWTFQYDEDQGIAGPRTAAVNGLALRVPLPEPEAEGATAEQSATELVRRLYVATGDWVQRLSRWIEVATGQYLVATVETPVLRSRSDELELFYVDGQGSAQRIPDERPLTVKWEMPGNFVNEAIWRAVLDRACAGSEPPTERLLLHDARMGLRRRHPRRAVLDAGTAAEIALTRLLDQQLRSLPPAGADVIRDQGRELGRLVRTVRRLGVPLPDYLQDKLVRPRNEAIHAGQNIDIETARSMVNLAGELVEQARPLNELLDL
jgi:hypothetical protein